MRPEACRGVAAGGVVEGAEGRGITLGLIAVVGGGVGGLGVDVPEDDAGAFCSFARRFKRIYNYTHSKAKWKQIISFFGYFLGSPTWNLRDRHLLAVWVCCRS